MSRHNKFAEDSKVLSVVVPKDTKDRIAKVAKVLGQSVSDVSRSAILVGMRAIEKDACVEGV